MKTILSVQEQIQHMKEKGITFQHVTEAEAADFLANNTYYMKLAAYRANYMKYETGARAGQYRDLDFGYLKELSTLDMHLRYFVLQMCLDIEHAIKVQLIRQITQDENEDGYEAVKDFLKEDENFYILKSISRQKSGEYCKNLIEKYYPYFPAWVFVEVVSFGTLFRFYKNYNRKHVSKGCLIYLRVLVVKICVINSHIISLRFSMCMMLSFLKWQKRIATHSCKILWKNVC